MSGIWKQESAKAFSLQRSMLLIIASAFVSSAAFADIIWEGDYETGNFMQWPNPDKSRPNFSAVPNYCRPPGPSEYFGDGSCLELSTDVVRNGQFAAKFTVKNSQNARGEPEDCEGLPDCTRRKVELKSWYALEDASGTKLSYMSERWISVSHFIPSDWSDAGSGWGPIVFQIKPYINNSPLSPAFSIALNNGSWQIAHRWSDVKHINEQVPWQQQMFYSGDYDGDVYPRSDYWPEGMVDFPDAATSYSALRSVNKGGWTDWIIHVKFDARGSAAGGSGFLEVYKREDSGPWIEVLDIRPRVMTRGGVTFDRGIAYNQPPREGVFDNLGDQGGFAVIAGMYLQKGQVWNLPANRVMYNDNIKIGDENSNIAEMSPSAEVTDMSKPEPPVLLLGD